MAATAESLTPSSEPQQGGSVVVLAILLTFFVILVALFWPYTCDDAFITYRYAEHLAAGVGPAFNPGELVEGYSNPLWLGLLVVGVKLGGDVVIVSKVLGLLCGLGTVLLAYGIARRLGREGDDRPVWVLLLVVPNAGLAYFAASGMETILYAGLLTAVVYCFLRSSPAAVWAGNLATLAAALTRPEGLLVLVALSAWRLASAWRQDRGVVVAAWASGVLALAALGGFFVWRHAVFGDWLPNTYYAKPPGAFGGLSYLSPAGYLREYFAETGGGLLLGLACAVLLIRRQGEDRRAVVAAAVATGLLLLIEGALVVHARGDWMALHRFLVPITAVVAAWGMAGLVRLTASRPVAMIAAALLGTVSFVQLLETWEGFRDRHYPYEVMGSVSQREAGRWLRRTFPPGTVLACKRIGGIAYYSDLRLVDALGLTDRRIARIRHTREAPGEAQYAAMAEEVISRQPDLVLLCVLKAWPDVPRNRPAPDIPGNLRDVDKALYPQLLRQGYQFLCRYPQGDGELAVYRRPGFAMPPSLHLDPLP
jgi:arabinofuranosyltransferase